MPSINAQTTPFAAIIQTSDGTGNLALQTANVTALNINSSQVVSLTNPLPVASGGTGAANLSSITVGNVSGIVAIANGGTNATTASSALSNLGGVTTGKSIAMSIVFG